MFDGQVRDETFVYIQKLEEVAHYPKGLVSQILEQPDSNMLLSECLEVPFDLSVVETFLFVIPIRPPIISHTLLFRLQCLGEASERFTTDLHQVHEVGVSSLRWIAKNGDDLGVGNSSLYKIRSVRTVQVRGRCLANSVLVGNPVEQRLIVSKIGYGSDPATRPLEVRVHALEEVRLFDGAHVDLWVLVEVVVERGRPRLLCPYYEEVGHRHARR